MAKCRPVRFAKEKYQSCPRVITDFYSKFEFVFPLAFHWSGLKPIGYFVVESFDEGVGFSWRAYRNIGSGYTCVDFAMGLFVDTIETTTLLTGFNETEITYLAATNAEWLPYLVDEGIRFVHYLANRVEASLDWIRTFLMPFIFLWSPLLLSDPFRGLLLLNFEASTLLQLPLQAH